MFATLILSASLGQATQQCPSGTCPRVQAAVQTVGQAIHVGNVPTLTPAVPQQMAAPRQPVRDFLRAVFGRCR